MCAQSRVPPAPTSFVGREAELAILQQSVAASWLVTLVGPAGMGKTRLAHQFLTLDPHEERNKWFIELDRADDAYAVAGVVADALDARGDSFSQLAQAIADRQPCLIVLDNCEQVLAPVRELLTAAFAFAPDARFLATSRERLGARGERVFELPPLSLPEGDGSPDTSEALRLFVERAQLARADYKWRPEQASVLAELVRRLEGMPLALELAAARVALIGESELLEQMNSSLDLLSAGPQDAPARQRTMRAAIDWSWRRLSTSEQAALAQCSVFRGSFTFSVAERVVECDDNVLAVLSSLRNQSLIRQDSVRGDLRLALYSTVRAFAAEQLAKDARSERATWKRLEAVYRDLAPLWGERLELGGLQRDAKVLLAELPSLMAVVERATQAPADAHASETAHIVAGALAPLLRRQGPVERYAQLLESVLALELPADSPQVETRLRLQLLRAFSFSRVGRPDDSFRGAAMVEELASKAGFRALVARARQLQARLLRHRGRLDQARPLFMSALEDACEAGAPLAEIRIRGEVASLLNELGEFPLALSMYRETLRTARAIGAQRDEALFTINHAVCLHRQQRLDEAEAECTRGLELAQHVDAPQWVALATENLGLILQERGDLEGAMERLSSAQMLYRSIGDQWHASVAAAEHADIEHEAGLAQQALRRYDEAIDAMLRVGKKQRALLARAARAALWASQGDPERATKEMEDIHKELERAPALLRSAVETYGGIIVHAQARAQATAGQLEQASQSLREASSRLEAALSSESRSEEQRLATRLLERALAQGLADPSALLVGPDGRWFRPPNAPAVNLSRRRSLRRIFSALVEQRALRDGASFSVEELLAIGWPSERVTARSGAARVYTALSTLRSLGLGELLESNEGKHALRRDVALVQSPSESPPA